MLTKSLIDMLYTILIYFVNSISVIGIMWVYQKVRNIKISFIKFAVAILFCVITYIFCFEILLAPVTQWILYDCNNDILSWAYVNITNYIVLVSLIYLFLEKDIKINLILTSILWAMYTFLLFGFNNFLYLISSSGSIDYLLLGILMAIMIALFQNFLAKKLHLNEIMIEFEKKNYSYLSIICISILIIMAFAWTQIIIPKGKAEFRLEEVMIIFLVITFSIVLVQYAYNLLKIKQENEYNQIVLHQQQLYIQDLEDIQQNMRAFKHDYKNMMSSLYLNSKEGNIKKVENLIQGMIDDFDDTIDSKMALTTQLSNIRESEVKSLLFKKITDIYHKKISFHLEVLYPLHKNKIQTIDLVRILGILMDNAIEEVEQNHNDLTLLILQEENSLTIVVENYVEKEVNINDINNSGFTTKKDHSGIGLQSLETIIEKYPNISHKVSCRNHRFIQEIIIFNS